VQRRIRAAEALSETEARYQMLFHQNPLPMLGARPGHARPSWPSTTRQSQKYGYSAEEFAAMTVRDLHTPEEGPWISEKLSGDKARAPLANGLVVRHRKKDGADDLRPKLSPGWSALSPGREAKLALADDITERKKAEDRDAGASRAAGPGQ
jgi:PAS domain-containing protein